MNTNNNRWLQIQIFFLYNLYFTIFKMANATDVFCDQYNDVTYQRVKDEDTTLPLQRHVQSRRPTLKQISVAILSSSNVHRNISFVRAWPFNTEWLYIALMKSNQCNYTAERKWINQGTDKWNTLHSETLKMFRSQHSTALRALNHYKFHMSVLIN
jgi:hypothetical protein